MTQIPHFLSNIDLKLLAKQKRYLISLESDQVDGIVILIDYIQDYLVDELGYPEDVVFPKLEYDFKVNNTPYKTVYEGSYNGYTFEISMFDDDYDINWLEGNPPNVNLADLEQQIYESLTINKNTMEEYRQWLEQQIERCLNDKDLQREHWAFCKAYEKFIALRQPPVSGSASDFERELYKLINAYVSAGLKKPDLVHKMDAEINIAKMLKETPLKTRLEVSNQMAFISLLTELGFREDKYWTDDEDELLKKLCQSAKKHTEHQLQQIEEWKQDGEPLER